MTAIAHALMQMDEKITELAQVKQYLQEADRKALVNLYYDCDQKGIKLYHYLEDNRPLLRDITNTLTEVVQPHGFYFSKQEMTVNSEKITLNHETIGIIGELSLKKKRLWLWKNPFRFILINQHEYERLEEAIPSSEERLTRYEADYARYEKLPAPIKKLRGFTPKKMEEMNNILQFEKENLTNDRLKKATLVEMMQSDWTKFLERTNAFKAMLLALKEWGFTSDFHAFDDEKTFHLCVRADKSTSHAGMLTYEEGDIGFMHLGEWSIEDIKTMGLRSFSFSDDAFSELFNVLNEQFSNVTQTNDTTSRCIIIDLPNGSICIEQSGIIVMHGEDLNLYYLLRFPSIRNMLCTVNH